MDIMLVGEAWGEREEREKKAFVGGSGWLLNQMLSEAGINREECHATNVFNLRPPGNKIGYLCGPKSTGIHGYPPLSIREGSDGGNFVQRKYQRELDRLRDEILTTLPNVIIALGNTATWALLGRTAISKARGVVQLSTHTVTGFKVLPTYHPAAVMRQWNLNRVVVQDLMKAKRESLYPDMRRPKREIWIQPTLEDIYEFDRRYIQCCERLAVDIETIGRDITCIGLATSRSISIVIPFIVLGRTARAYWPDIETELKAWLAVRDILRRPIPKVFQNGLYDIAFLWRAARIAVWGAEHDTMLLHHALNPESLKSLGFLGSMYTDEGSWKQMRQHSKTIKRED
jgi:DNA polymerase